MADVQNMIELFDRHVIANYTRFPVTVERAEGSYFWDSTGKRYLDLFAGWAVASIGHSHRPGSRWVWPT